MPRVSGTHVGKLGVGAGLFVEFSGESASQITVTLTATPTQITGALRDIASVDHEVAVRALLAALESERGSDERRVGALWIALERAVQMWRTERVDHLTVPAASTTQARREMPS